MNNLVSIVIPTFNRSCSLKRAISSVVEQTYSNWEIIVVDNSSTDDTLEMLKQFKCHKLSVVSVQNNGIIGYSRNVGIRKSKGEFVAFLDSDDWWDKDKLRKSISDLIKHKSDVVYHNCTIVLENNVRSVSNCRQLNENTLEDLVVNGNTLITSSVVVNRKSLLKVEGFSEDYDVIGWEDYHLWLKLANSACKFYKTNGAYGFYWQGGGNFDNPNQIIINLANIGLFLRKHYSLKVNSNKIWWIDYTYGRAYLKMADFKNAKLSFVKVLMSSAPLVFKLKSIYWRCYMLFMRFNSHRVNT